MDATSEKRLSEVNPVLADKVRQMATKLAQEGIEIRVVQGLRSWAEQDALYAQGRTKPGKIVTNTKGGYSWHCYGNACDVVPDDVTMQGFQCDWNVNHPAWKRIAEVAKEVGLVSGSEWKTFKDWPHAQYTGKFGVNPNDEVRQIFKVAGMAGVWQSM